MSQILYFQLGDIDVETSLLSADTVKMVIASFIRLDPDYPSGFPSESGRIQRGMNLRWWVITH